MSFVSATVIILIVMYLMYVYKQESLTNVSEDQQAIIDKLYAYITQQPDATFEDYLNFLTSIENTNLKLINNDVFAGFKALHKKGKFSKQDIADEM